MGQRIKDHVAKTKNVGTVSSIGGFGGLFDLSPYGFKQPILVSGTDGVGSKLEIAKELGIYHTVGIDLVAMCVNDVVTVGAKPLYFLDYIAVEKNYPEMVESLGRIRRWIKLDLKCGKIKREGRRTDERNDL